MSEYYITEPIEYNGFTINPGFNIFKNGKMVSFPECLTLEEAKCIIDLSNSEKIRQKVGTVSSAPVLTHEEYETMNRYDEIRKMEDHYLLELMEYEK